MPGQRPAAATWGGVTLIAVGLTVLAVAVAALSIAALRQGRIPGDGDVAGPAPTFTYGPRTSSATPAPAASSTPAPTISTTPSPTPTASPVPAAPGSDERFLTVGAEAMWRGTAGSCGGAAPLVERSSDDGATWQIVTPTTKGISRLLSLTSFGGRNATAVADLGGDCAPTTLRTYTDGEFWETYPDIFASDTYIGPSAVVVDGKSVAPPCAAPWGLRSASGTTALVCDDTAYRLDGDTWTAIENGARAVAVTATEIYIARTDAACTGIRLTAHATDGTPTDLGCTDLDPSEASAPLALDSNPGTSGTVLYLWAGQRLIQIAG